jgi:hypothetical protein
VHSRRCHLRRCYALRGFLGAWRPDLYDIDNGRRLSGHPCQHLNSLQLHPSYVKIGREYYFQNENRRRLRLREGEI